MRQCWLIFSELSLHVYYLTYSLWFQKLSTTTIPVLLIRKLRLGNNLPKVNVFARLRNWDNELLQPSSPCAYILYCRTPKYIVIAAYDQSTDFCICQAFLNKKAAFLRRNKYYRLDEVSYKLKQEIAITCEAFSNACTWVPPLDTSGVWSWVWVYVFLWFWVKKIHMITLSENNWSHPTLLFAAIDRRNVSIIWEKGYLEKTEQEDKHFVNPVSPELQLNQLSILEFTAWEHKTQ